MIERITSPSVTTRNETYPDGSFNVVADTPGQAIDLSDTGSKHLHLGPNSLLNITTEAFDEDSQKVVRSHHIITEGGYGPGAILTSVKGEPGVRYQLLSEGYNPEWIEALRATPLTIGSRTSRLKGDKLTSISGLRSVGEVCDEPSKKTANPITVALRVMDEHSIDS